jgi:hypothetical protein
MNVHGADVGDKGNRGTSFNYSIGEGNSLNYKIIAQPGVPPERQGKSLASH